MKAWYRGRAEKRALLLVGHKILCAVYHVLHTGLPYQAFSVEEFEKIRHQRRITYLQNELRELGVSS